VSVVIPTNNREGFLAQSLRSALGQQGVDLEVVVVDDGSNAGAVSRVPGIGDSRVRVVRHAARQGVSTARNTGIAAAEGGWVAFLDDDDLWAPRKLRAQIEALEASPGREWSCVGVVVVNRALRVVGWEPCPAGPDVSGSTLERQVVPGGGSGVLVSRGLLDRLGGFDPALTLNEDWDLHVRLAQQSLLSSVDAPLLAYRLHPTNRSLDVEVCDREFAVIDERYAPLRAARGVALDHAHWNRWKAYTHARAGRRREALQSLRAARPVIGWRNAARDALVTALPGSVRARELRRARAVPSAWRAEAEEWLRLFR
jgi:glycosyltransferase involved in cell wall biosynthesis